MTSAWLDKDKLPNAMLNANFASLGNADHFPALKECFSIIKDNAKSIIDVGCGAAEASRVFSEYDYFGADLPHIVEKVSKHKNPDAKYITFNASNTDFLFLQDKDVVLMNSFISELSDWYLVLSKILINSKKYVVLHRQEVTDSNSYLQEYTTYGGLRTVKSIINKEQLHRLFYMNEFKIVKESSSFPYNSNHRTYLLEKND